MTLVVDVAVQPLLDGCHRRRLRGVVSALQQRAGRADVGRSRLRAGGRVVPRGDCCAPYSRAVPSRSRSATHARRRQRRMSKVEHDLTDTQWAALQAAWGGCGYCGATDRALQKDCLLPISRGGRYTLANVVPACGSCNASKCNEEVTRWLRRKRLDEAAFLLRYRETVISLAGSADPANA